MSRRMCEIRRRMRAKVAGNTGETLVETLVATLIMGLVMLMLCTAIVSAAKINATAKANDITFNHLAEEDAAPASVGMTVTIDPAIDGVADITLTTTDNKIKGYEQNGYYYYELY